MTGKRGPVHSNSERWPLVSLSDNRSLAARRYRPFGAAAWHPRDDDNRRICEKLIEIRDHERQMALDQGRDWLGLGSRQYCYRLKTAGFLFVNARELTKERFRARRAHSRSRTPRRATGLKLGRCQ